MDLSRRRLLSGLVALAAAAAGTRWAFTSRPGPIGSASVPAGSPTTAAQDPPSTIAAPAVPTTTAVSTTTSTEPVPAVEIEVIGREGWGAEPVRGSYVEHRPARITVHHTQAVLGDNRDAPARFRQHQRLHQSDRGWPDLAYHLMIDRDGNVYQGRPLDVRGDTATTYDPTGHLLPCLEGDFNLQDPTDVQIDALVTVVAWMMSTYRIGSDLVAGHRDFADTSCPGDRLYPRLDEIRLRAFERSAERIELSVIEGAEAIARVADITG